MTNYAALGEYTAYTQQARDAAGRRYALLFNLSNQFRKLAEEPETAIQPDVLQNTINDIVATEREMRAAMERANQSADLCNKPAINLRSLSKF